MKNRTLHANKLIKGHILCTISIIQTIKHLFNMSFKTSCLHLPPSSNIFCIPSYQLTGSCNSLCSTHIFTNSITCIIPISLSRRSSGSTGTS